MPNLKKCASCEYATTKEFNLRRHEKSHKNNERQLVHNAEKEHKCPLCVKTERTRIAMIHHFVKDHDIKLKETRLDFPNFDDFLKWKEEFERTTASRFVRHRGAWKGRDSLTHHSFRCHRDGFFVSRGEGKRHLKKLGSNKIDGCCPAEIKVSVDEGNSRVEVEVIQNHVGHSNDVGRLNLTLKEKERLAAKIALKRDMKVILDEVREELISGDLSRIDLLTRKDLVNIARQFNLGSAAMRDKNEWINVDSWVKENLNSVVRFYKPQGVLLESHPQLAEEDFILVIANDPQIILMGQYGNDCICLDGTHGLNQYDFELTTLLVVDDLRQGFPSAFMLSNKSDSNFVSIFLRSIKEALGHPLTPAIFMSDMSEVYINAWNAVMSPPKSQLFCSWHVDRAWRKNLSKVKGGVEKKKQVYKTIRTLLQKGEKDNFSVLLKSALDSFKSDPDTAVFGTYFQNEYSGNVHQWAYCYRSHLGLNTNMHLECMHKVLKHYHFQGKKVKRLALCIDGLMKFIRDKLFGRLIAICRGTVSSKIAALRSTHKKAQETKGIVLRKTGDNSWTISSRSSSTTHDIVEGELNCSCDIKCDECGICIHSYKCSCNDSAINWNICVHIHYMIMNSPPASQVKQESLQLTIANSDDEELVIAETSTSKDVQKQAIIKHFSKTEVGLASFEDRKKAVESKMRTILDRAQNMKHLDIISNALAPITNT